MPGKHKQRKTTAHKKQKRGAPIKRGQQLDKIKTLL